MTGDFKRTWSQASNYFKLAIMLVFLFHLFRMLFCDYLVPFCLFSNLRQPNSQLVMILPVSLRKWKQLQREVPHTHIITSAHMPAPVPWIRLHLHSCEINQLPSKANPFPHTLSSNLGHYPSDFFLSCLIHFLFLLNHFFH